MTDIKVDFRAENSIRNNECHLTKISGLIKNNSSAIYASQNVSSRYMKLNRQK